MLALPAVAGSAITLVLVNVFPARRTRDLLSIVALGAAAGVILLFRLIRPEQLARPEGFRNLLDFITVLRTPTSPFLPSEWAAKAIMGFLRHNFDPLPLLLLWSTAAALVTLGGLLHRELFATGYTKAQEGAERFVRGTFWRWTVGTLLLPLPVAKREFVLKDVKLFFRDTTQWSQLILLAVLVVVYLFNIKALPLHRGEPVGFFYVTLVSFLNLGLSGFVLASMALGFGALYPQFETENAAQIPTSFGGLVYMMATIALLAGVIVALWQAVYVYVHAVYEGRPVVVDAWMLFWFTVAAALCAAATVIPLRVGLKKMESFEF